MNNNKRNLVNTLMDKENPYITSYKLKEYGLNTYDVKTLVDDGIIERVRRGLYRWVLVESTYNEIVEIVNIVPDGVICLFSALSFYELTTYIPKEYNVAILRKTRKPILPKYPPVKIIYFLYPIFESLLQGNEFFLFWDKNKKEWEKKVN